MSLLIISIVNLFVLIVSAQNQTVAIASVATDSASPVVVSSTSWSSDQSKPRTVPKVYSECGSACPRTCAEPNPRVCILVCVPGKFCPEGYYENSAGQCVLLEDCDSNPSTTTPQPPKHLPGHIVGRPQPRPTESKPQTVPKIYNQCGTACPLTCAEPKPRACSRQCVPGKFCPEGYYENSAGQCVLLEDCDSNPSTTTPQPPKHLPGHIVGHPRPRPPMFPYGHPPPPPPPFPHHPQFEFPGFPGPMPDFPQFNSTGFGFPKHVKTVPKEFSECGSACPPSCDNLEPICITQCKVGFFCPQGFVLNSNNQCIRPQDC